MAGTVAPRNLFSATACYKCRGGPGFLLKHCTWKLSNHIY